MRNENKDRPELKPNFLIIGAGRSGTTSLHHYLSQHPDVCMSDPKETFFFLNDEYEKGIGFYLKKYFSGWSGERAVGESDPGCLRLPHVPLRLKESLPDVRLIASLRNPVDRAYSAWWWRNLPGTEQRSFQQAMLDDLQKVNEGGLGIYLDEGYYAKGLQRYLALFPRDRLKIILFDDFEIDPLPSLREICEFLGVETRFQFRPSIRYNVATPLRVRSLASFARITHLRDVLPASWKAGFRLFASKLFAGTPAMDPATRNWLADHYYDHNRELEKIVDRDLSHWDK